MDSFEDFRKQLRNTLNHLYDPDYLRRSSFSTLLNSSRKFDTPVALQRMLEEAIESLRPTSDKPTSSLAWHTYDILVSRYIHRLTQEEVANQIGVSTRQLAREQNTAVDILAAKLWNEYHLSGYLSTRKGDVSEQPLDELSWLAKIPADQLTDVRSELDIITTLIQPLTRRYNVGIVIDQANLSNKISVHPVAFRQALLSVMSAAVSVARDGTVKVTFENISKYHIIITIATVNSGINLNNNNMNNNNLDHVQNIMEMIRGNVEFERTEKAFTARFTFPTVQPIKVLVVDDNQDFINLFIRYTSGTNFEVIGTRKSNEIFPLVEVHQPRGIILDIMMPEIDGWQLLTKLHHHPLTRRIPIIICSIMPNEELAYTLGASGYIRKPVTRDHLLLELGKIMENEALKSD